MSATRNTTNTSSSTNPAGSGTIRVRVVGWQQEFDVPAVNAATAAECLRYIAAMSAIDSDDKRMAETAFKNKPILNAANGQHVIFVSIPVTGAQLLKTLSDCRLTATHQRAQEVIDAVQGYLPFDLGGMLRLMLTPAEENLVLATLWKSILTPPATPFPDLVVELNMDLSPPEDGQTPLAIIHRRSDKIPPDDAIDIPAKTQVVLVLGHSGAGKTHASYHDVQRKWLKEVRKQHPEVQYTVRLPIDLPDHIVDIREFNKNRAVGLFHHVQKVLHEKTKLQSFTPVEKQKLKKSVALFVIVDEAGGFPLDIHLLNKLIKQGNKLGFYRVVWVFNGTFLDVNSMEVESNYDRRVLKLRLRETFANNVSKFKQLLDLEAGEDKFNFLFGSNAAATTTTTTTTSLTLLVPSLRPLLTNARTAVKLAQHLGGMTRLMRDRLQAEVAKIQNNVGDDGTHAARVSDIIKSVTFAYMTDNGLYPVIQSVEGVESDAAGLAAAALHAVMSQPHASSMKRSAFACDLVQYIKTFDRRKAKSAVDKQKHATYFSAMVAIRCGLVAMGVDVTSTGIVQASKRAFVLEMPAALVLVCAVLLDMEYAAALAFQAIDGVDITETGNIHEQRTLLHLRMEHAAYSYTRQIRKCPHEAIARMLGDFESVVLAPQPKQPRLKKTDTDDAYLGGPFLAAPQGAFADGGAPFLLFQCKHHNPKNKRLKLETTIDLIAECAKMGLEVVQTAAQSDLSPPPVGDARVAGAKAKKDREPGAANQAGKALRKESDSPAAADEVAKAAAAAEKATKEAEERKAKKLEKAHNDSQAAGARVREYIEKWHKTAPAMSIAFASAGHRNMYPMCQLYSTDPVESFRAPDSQETDAFDSQDPLASQQTDADSPIPASGPATNGASRDRRTLEIAFYSNCPVMLSVGDNDPTHVLSSDENSYGSHILASAELGKEDGEFKWTDKSAFIISDNFKVPAVWAKAGVERVVLTVVQTGEHARIKS